MFIFKNKVTFISGATGNIGQNLCFKFAELGSDLIITDKNNKQLILLKKQINKKYKIKINFFLLIYLLKYQEIK